MSVVRRPRAAVLVLGGTSEIGLAIVRRLSVDGPVSPYCIGRDRERLAAAARTLEGRRHRPGRDRRSLDADEIDAHGPRRSGGVRPRGRLDLVVLAVGVLGGQDGLRRRTREGARSAARQRRRRGLAAAAIPAPPARPRGAGTLVVLSSVAAERPRASNAIYGAAKAGLDSLAQGLADATAGSGVRVLVVRPGFVTTRMTAGLEPAPFATTPQAVAEATVAGLAAARTPSGCRGVLRWLFAVLRHLPRPIFRRLPL